jgi:hypothetical protein
VRFVVNEVALGGYFNIALLQTVTVAFACFGFLMFDLFTV